MMVELDELVDAAPSRTRSASARIEEVMLDKGFRVVDKKQFENITGRDIAKAEGNPALARELGHRYGAEVLIVGTVDVNFESEQEFYSVKNYQYLGKGVAKASQVGAKRTGRSMDAQTANNLQEGSAHRAVGQRSAGLGNEEGLRKTVIP